MIDFHEENTQVANEIYGSAFYYGNFSKEEWVDMLTNLLNSASERGIEYVNYWRLDNGK